MSDTQNIIVRLLKNIGSQKEVEQYLKRFSNVDQNRFAIIKIGGKIIENRLEQLCSSLTFLSKVGLIPVVVHGAGPQLNKALEEAGIEPKFVDGMRFTNAEVLSVARKVFMATNLRIVDKLEEMGTKARPVSSGVLKVDFQDEKKLGFVGKVTDIDISPISSAIKSGHIPVICSLGETSSGQILNVNADVVARELAFKIEPYKIVFLTETGGLLNQYGQVISSINLVEQYDDLMEKEWVHSGMRLKIQQIKELLSQLPFSSSVSVTSPQNLARELFTHSGAGTFVHKGDRISEYESFGDLDKTAVKDLLEECFKKDLAKDYFKYTEVDKIYFSQSQRAIAILSKKDGLSYLNKFAVTEQAQGEGLGSAVWYHMKKEHPKLFWRSRIRNQINSWYFKIADGCYKTDDWIVFWSGLEDYDEIKVGIDLAMCEKVDFRDNNKDTLLV